MRKNFLYQRVVVHLHGLHGSCGVTIPGIQKHRDVALGSVGLAGMGWQLDLGHFQPESMILWSVVRVPLLTPLHSSAQDLAAALKQDVAENKRAPWPC